MVDKAIVIEIKLMEKERDGKRKMPMPTLSSGSNIRPRFSQPSQFFKQMQMNRSQMSMQMQCNTHFLQIIKFCQISSALGCILNK
jgi:hypothetical protein